MKKSLLLLFSLLIFVSFTTALDVDLLEPSNGAQLQYEINNIPFKCNVSGAVAVRLYTDISGSWDQMGSTIYEGGILHDDGVVTFLVSDVPEGSYQWNCFANDVFWAPENYTFSFKFPPNNPPECVGDFPSIEMEKNVAQTDVLNLNDYFFDDKDELEFIDIFGDDNIDITIKTSGMIDITPHQDAVAVDNIYFIANDGVNDDLQCGPMTVTITDPGGGEPTNTAPSITPEIPDQTKEDDVSFWEVDLDDYVEDSETGDDGLDWDVSGVDTSIIEITINDISHKAKFEPQGIGEDTITFTVTDPDGLEDEQDVVITITATSGEEESEEEEQEEDDEETVVTLLSQVPEDENQELDLGGSLDFFITFSGDGEVIWYVNGEEAKRGADNFEFKPDRAGNFEISVRVSDAGDSDEFSWSVNVGGSGAAKLIELSGEAEALCGNGEINEGENCETCSEDVTCGEGEECIEGECITQETNLITGNVVKDFVVGNKFPLIGVVVVIILFLFFVRKVRRKKKSQDTLHTYIGKKPGEEKKPLIKEIKEERPVTPPSVDPIIGFIQSGLAAGDEEKTIRRGLLKSGWSRKQIKQAFKSIKK